MLGLLFGLGVVVPGGKSNEGSLGNPPLTKTFLVSSLVGVLSPVDVEGTGKAEYKKIKVSINN